MGLAGHQRGCPVTRCIDQASSYTQTTSVLERSKSAGGSSSPSPSPSSSSSNSSSSSLSGDSLDHDMIKSYNASIYAFTSSMWQDLRKDIERRASTSS